MFSSTERRRRRRRNWNENNSDSLYKIQNGIYWLYVGCMQDDVIQFACFIQATFANPALDSFAARIRVYESAARNQTVCYSAQWCARASRMPQTTLRNCGAIAAEIASLLSAQSKRMQITTGPNLLLEMTRLKLSWLKLWAQHCSIQAFRGTHSHNADGPCSGELASHAPE